MMLLSALFLGAAVAGCGGVSSAAPRPVANAAALGQALGAVRGGEEILLAPGDYGDVVIVNRAFPATVTLRSATPGQPAKIRRLRVANSRNLRFADLEIGDGLRPGEPRWTRMAEVANSQCVGFDAVHVHGSLDGDPRNDGWGVFVRDSGQVSVSGSEFQHLWRGILVQSSDGLTVRGNRFHDLQSDGANFAGVSNVRVEGNLFRDFYPEGADHADAIQFWTAGQSRGNNGVVIRDNVVLQGAGDGLQGFFLGNELKLPSHDVVIENNFLYSGVQYHGIAVHNWDRVRIAGNTVVSPAGDAARYWIRLFEAKDVVLAGNVTDDIVLETARPVMTDNVVLAKGGGGARMRRALNGGAPPIDELIVPGRGYQPHRAQGN